jgi:hydrogenase-4 component F
VILAAAILFAVAPALWCALPRSHGSAPIVAAFGLSGSLAASILIAVRAADDGSVVAINRWISVDAFGALIVLLIAAVSWAAALYSIGDIARQRPTPVRVRSYYANLCLFSASMLLVAMSVEPAVAWIAVELTTLFSALLVAYADTREALEASWKYLTITLLGSTAAVLGILVLYWAAHAAGNAPFTYGGLASEIPSLNTSLVAAAFALLLVGFGAKVGIFPMHTWLPDAHSQAPAAVCAMLSGIETTAVLYVLLRLSPVFLGVSGVHAAVWFAVFGTASIAAAALLLLQARDLKRLFAFSTVENMGIVLLAVSLATPAGNLGAVWQMLAHTVSKSLCFFAAGAVAVTAGTTDLAQLRSLRHKSGLPTGALLAGALAVTGAPPFALFLSEIAIASAAIYAGQLWLAAILLLFIGVAFAGVLPKVARIVLGDGPAADCALAVPLSMTLVVIVALVSVVLLGLWIPSGLASLLTQAATQMASP